MKVVVDAPSRLHLGFYNFFEDGIAYGSLGVAIEEPKFLVRLWRSNKFEIINKTEVELTDIIGKVVEKFNIMDIGISIEKAIPRHVGLGSTTQGILSLGYGISKLFNFSYSVRDIALMFGRGRDSGIGIAVFEKGGFIIDSGRRIDDIVRPPKDLKDLPLPMIRKVIPRNWYFLVFIPKGVRGLDEVVERRAMDQPSSLPRDLQYELYKLILLHIVPSIDRKDIVVFGKAITKLQVIVGTYFSKYQKGIYCCEETEIIINSLLNHGAYGAGQSSWGPTAYGIVEGRKRALKILDKVLNDIYRKGFESHYMIVRARNYGVKISLEK